MEPQYSKDHMQYRILYMIEDLAHEMEAIWDYVAGTPKQEEKRTWTEAEIIAELEAM